MQGWDVAVEYLDHESSGRVDRAEFRRMFADAAQRKFDLVLVWALDRFTREGVAETFEYIKRLTLHGVQMRGPARSWPEIARACDAGVATERRAYRSMPGDEGVAKSPD